MKRWWLLVGIVALTVGTTAGASRIALDEDRFNHPEHRGLFPSCTTCHAGMARPGDPVWPAPASCGACHDGEIAPAVEWTPPTTPPVTNLRFDHEGHASVLVREDATPARCIDCHADPDAPWMSVRLAAVEQCLSCHQVDGDHLAAPDAACAVCHLPLARAQRLTVERIATFEAPASHEQIGFALAGHGAPAGGPGTGTDAVAASCATCHARDFCITCHVDAPEQISIQALESDPRSLAHDAALVAPSDHEASDFPSRHGAPAGNAPGNCVTCHTQESCVVCHQAAPAVADGVYRSGPGRGPGAVVTRTPPSSHAVWFRERHETEAAAAPETCAGCHARQDCLDCHRPDAASSRPGYHPDDFLSRHPTAAYFRETSCNDCHNASSFCTSCHASAGLVAGRDGLGAGYHDAKGSFTLGHGQAARQNLESCVSCHTERDCLACHSAIGGGRRFNPHGPGFDAGRLRARAPQVCSVCHGARIP